MMFSKKPTIHPQPRFIYAVTKGAYLGELLVYMESAQCVHNFLSLPDMKTREIPQDKFELGLQDNIVDIVEQLPNDVFTTCQAQYKKNKTLICSAA